MRYADGHAITADLRTIAADMRTSAAPGLAAQAEGTSESGMFEATVKLSPSDPRHNPPSDS